MDVDTRGAAAGFLAAAVVLAVLLYAVGVDAVVRTVLDMDLGYLVLLVVASLAWLVTWGLALRVVLDALGVPVSVRDALLMYASAVFANNVTPFGQAGGEPFSAFIISRATDVEYERGLAAIASVDTLNFFPSIFLALVGLAYYVAVFTVGDRLLQVIGVVVALAVGIPLGGYLLWRGRGRVQALLVRGLTPGFRLLGRVLPRVSAPSRQSITERVTAFFGAVERVGQSRRHLVVALSFSTAGWLCMVATLWLTLAGMGHAVPVAAALIAVPVGTIASVTPLPGGLGGVEFAIVLVIVPITGVSPATASAAALVSRVATYVLPTVLGGLAAAALEGRTG